MLYRAATWKQPSVVYSAASDDDPILEAAGRVASNTLHRLTARHSRYGMQPVQVRELNEARMSMGSHCFGVVGSGQCARTVLACVRRPGSSRGAPYSRREMGGNQEVIHKPCTIF
jgi:hypothetical protein